MEAFLASNDGKDFALTPPDNFCAPLDASGRFAALTPTNGCDGFFGAVLTRNPDGWSRPQRRRPNSKGGDKGGDKGGNKGGDKGGKQAKGGDKGAATRAQDDDAARGLVADIRGSGLGEPSLWCEGRRAGRCEGGCVCGNGGA